MTIFRDVSHKPKLYRFMYFDLKNTYFKKGVKMDYTVYDLILADEDGNLFSYTGDCSWIADQNFDDKEVKQIKDLKKYFKED